MSMKGTNTYLNNLLYPFISSTYDGMPVAIKFLPYFPETGSQSRERDISIMVKHSSIITTYGYAIVSPLPFYGFGHYVGGKQLVLVMERADCDLVYYLATVHMTYCERKHLIVEIGRGLEYLYIQNICNHDIKV